MMLLYKEFLSDQYISKTKEFLDLISLSSSGCSLTKVVQEPIILKEGYVKYILKAFYLIIFIILVFCSKFQNIKESD